MQSPDPTAPASAAPAAFDFEPRTRLIFGPGSLGRLGQLVPPLGARRVLVVTDSGLVTAGHATRVEHLLQAAGVDVVLYDRVRENPTTRDVDQCVAVAREAGIDALLGLGGGSSLDTAKGCNFLLTNGGRMQDYWGVGKATKPMLPFIAVPTTAGTGSECQSAALIADEVTHQKMACLDSKAAARVAILDPALTLSQPLRVTACTGIDAIAHALETAVTKPRTALSRMYSREAFQLCASNFSRVLSHPHDIDARGGMLLGAAFAGTAIENSMLGAAHAAANPLTAHFNIIHGQAVGLMLPAVMRFNASDPEVLRAYADLAAATGMASSGDKPERAVETLVAQVETWLREARFPRTLREYGVERSQIKMLAEEAERQWTAKFNPRPVTADQFAQVYESVME